MPTTRSVGHAWLGLLLALTVVGAGPAAATPATAGGTLDRIEAHVAEGLTANRVPGGESDLTAAAAFVGATFAVAAIRRLLAIRAARRGNEPSTATTEPPLPLETVR